MRKSAYELENKAHVGVSPGGDPGNGKSTELRNMVAKMWSER